MIRDAEESRLGQFRLITCKIATSDAHVLNPCCQGVRHAFSLDQSQVKWHQGLTCVRVCVLLRLPDWTKCSKSRQKHAHRAFPRRAEMTKLSELTILLRLGKSSTDLSSGLPSTVIATVSCLW